MDAILNRGLDGNGSLEDLGRELWSRRKSPKFLKSLTEPSTGHVTLGVRDSVRAQDLRRSGWAVIYGEGVGDDVREALQPLVEIRRKQAAGGFRDLTKGEMPRHGESRRKYFNRLGVRSGGSVDPNQLPYYLLLVGSPTEISFPFQYELDAQYAVGRLYFPKAEDYRSYALSVMRAEQEAAGRRRCAFWGPWNAPNDPTGKAVKNLLTPLARDLPQLHAGWSFDSHLGADASKSRLLDLLRGNEGPSILFAACHGLTRGNWDSSQRKVQGSLVAQDWPGGQAAIPLEACLTGEDIAEDFDLCGRILFHFACFSAGTPIRDDFQVLADEYLSAGEPFLSALPQQLLSAGDGRGAMAVVGHVDRVWTRSFEENDVNLQDSQVYQDTLSRIIQGKRIGHAMELINQFYLSQVANLFSLKDELRGTPSVPDAKTLASLWLSSVDARNFILLGDPAVRLTPGQVP